MSLLCSCSPLAGLGATVCAGSLGTCCPLRHMSSLQATAVPQDTWTRAGSGHTCCPSGHVPSFQAPTVPQGHVLALKTRSPSVPKVCGVLPDTCCPPDACSSRPTLSFQTCVVPSRPALYPQTHVVPQTPIVPYLLSSRCMFLQTHVDIRPLLFPQIHTIPMDVTHPVTL